MKSKLTKMVVVDMENSMPEDKKKSEKDIKQQCWVYIILVEAYNSHFGAINTYWGEGDGEGRGRTDTY